MDRQEKWDRRFLGLAQHIASWSRDPSTKVGAVIVDQDYRIISTGFNGFAKGVVDTHERYENRDLKYKMILHAERNCLLFARQSLKGCTLYTWPFATCAVCAAMVIQAGITRCVAPVLPDHLKGRWNDELELAMTMFSEAGVEVSALEGPIAEEPDMHDCDHAQTCGFCRARDGRAQQVYEAIALLRKEFKERCTAPDADNFEREVWAVVERAGVIPFTEIQALREQPKLMED